jgi:thioredoxin-related protein
MNRIATALLLLLACSFSHARLSSDYASMPYDKALEAVKADPSRHVMIYFGLETQCPPCVYTRNILSGGSLVKLYKPSFAIVDIDLRSPTPEQQKVIEKYGARWAPTLVYTDGNGKMLARMAKGFKNEKEAVLAHEFVTQKLYAKTNLDEYVKANFNLPGSQRVVPETKVAKKPPTPAADRPTLADVLAQKHERVMGDALKELLPAKRMEKENQDWFLTMDLQPGGKVSATGKRKDGKGAMKGDGVWYVTKKGKFCVDVKSQGLDESWCRHVFRVGDNYYYVTKDLRPKSNAYRFTLEKA